jgi:hypothetical protein
VTLTDDDIVALGEYCADLFAQDQFNTLVRHFELSCFQSFQTTRPEEKAARETAYADLSGLRSFLGMLDSFIGRGNDIIAERAPSSPDDAQFEEDE